jgi:hypothetical protein
MDGFHQLQPHPDAPPARVKSVQAAVVRLAPDQLHLRYMVWAPLDDLALPDPAEPERADGLWQTTCFELFIRGENTSYNEYNFAPSSRWAAYRFPSYRQDASPLLLPVPPQIDLSAAADLFDMEVVLASTPETAGPVSLTAVIEEADGTKSYWALAHPPEGPPDFHHPACFVLELPPPGTA